MSPTVPQVLIHRTAGFWVEAPAFMAGVREAQRSPGLKGVPTKPAVGFVGWLAGGRIPIPLCRASPREPEATKGDSGVPGTRDFRVPGWEPKDPKNSSRAMLIRGVLPKISPAEC